MTITFVEFMEREYNRKEKRNTFRKFTSFILPLVLIPLAIKGVQEIAKAVKKRKEVVNSGK